MKFEYSATKLTIFYQFFKLLFQYFNFQQKVEQEELERHRIREKECQEKMDSESKDVTKVAAKRNILTQKIDECTTKIQELGSMPSPEMVNKYMAYTSKNVS